MHLLNDKKFGFGCMRLPLTDSADPTSFNYPLIEKLFDNFLARGFTYFDTAYTYHGYHCEEAVRHALVERYPRDSFQLATKLPLRDFKDAEDIEKIFAEQLTNCGVEYFDFYLLHNMGMNVYSKCCEFDAFSFVAKMKAKGKIRNVGMSFHDTPELLEEIMSKYGDCLDFLQLQINYMDWEQPSVQSRRCLEIANLYSKPVVVMEPCKGGTLANVSETAKQLMHTHSPAASPASWALRYAAGQPGVFMVLSGMNSLEQVSDNCDSFSPFRPLDADEMSVIDKVREIISNNTAISCTGCEYCTQGCPKGISIPRYFALYNSIMSSVGGFSSQMVYYSNTALKHGKAGECIGCGQCEAACPQHLPIIRLLDKVAERFERTASNLPVRK